jgi:hypothetical protein
MKWNHKMTGLSLLLLLTLTACRTVSLPPVNFSEPGWSLHQGQAVWRPRRDAPEIAGELLAATRADGSAFAQFTKTPFPFAIAQMTATGWKIEFPPQNKHYSAPSTPPARIVWFQLANALAGKPLAKNWSWTKSEAGWYLENSSTGESLEGYFAQ